MVQMPCEAGLVLDYLLHTDGPAVQKQVIAEAGEAAASAARRALWERLMPGVAPPF